MTKAVAYLRVSGASQIEGNGFDRQLESVTTYARTMDIDIVGVYREEGVSGKTELESRPAFLSMLTDLLSNGCRTIIVERLDRLAREFRVQEELLLYLMRHQITLISADTGEDITAAMNADPMRRFVVQLQGLLAELDKNLTVAKLRKARQNVRARGEFAGGNVPYGYTPKRATPEQIEQSERERTTARRIRELRGLGMMFKDIREIITDEGHLPRNGKHWQLSTIRNIANQLERATT